MFKEYLNVPFPTPALTAAWPAWVDLLEFDSNNPFCKTFLDEILTGFHMGLVGVPYNLNQVCYSFVKTVQQFLDILNLVIKEVKQRKLEPVLHCPEFIISLHVVPKKGMRIVNGKSIPKVRIVRNGKQGGRCGKTAINEFIPKVNTSVLIPNMKEYARFLFSTTEPATVIEDDDECESEDPSIWDGKRHYGYGAAVDLKAAYRQIPIHFSEWKYLGYSVCGLNFVDHYSPFGISSGSQVCQRVTNYVCLGCSRKYFQLGAKISTKNYYDDILTAHKLRAVCQYNLDVIKKVLKSVGLITNAKKEFGPVQVFETNGWMWDLERAVIYYPLEKKRKLVEIIHMLLKYKICSIQFLFKVAGMIMDFARINPMVKAVCHSLLGKIYFALEVDIKSGKYLNMDHFLRIGDRIEQQLPFWLNYIESGPRILLLRLFSIPSLMIDMYTDASLFGYGIFCEGFYVAEHFPLPVLHFDIHILEFLTVLVAIDVFAETLSGRFLHLYVDNMAVVCTIRRKWAKDLFMMKCVYHLCHRLMTIRCGCHIEWIPTKENIPADALSRGDWHRFFQYINEHQLELFGQKLVDVFPCLLY